MNFTPVVTGADIKAVAALANIIWPEHYTQIIGTEQVQYMLQEIHSETTIAAEIKDNRSLYFLLQDAEQNYGYIGVQLKDGALFLSKLYILASARGLGFGRKAMSFIRELAEQHGKQRISLTVNKHNIDSIAAYYKMGFVKVDEVCVSIGQGYVMDDLLLDLKI